MSGVTGDRFTSAVEDYRGLHDDTQSDADVRRDKYMSLVNQYYDLATDFYEFGWGQSFHFAPRRAGETFKDSLARHEHYLAQEMDLRPGMRVLDIGCGVGGPMREIARYSGATVVGINNNAYQIERGERHSRKASMTGLTSFVKTDFMNLPFEDESIDAIYTIEASCHAPDKTALFTELHRVLKPGGHFAGYEWCLTDRYDPESARDRRIKKAIEEGDGLPDIAHTHEVDEALVAAGFELAEARDLASESHPSIPWYQPLTGEERSLKSLPRTPLGRQLTYFATMVMERLRIAPKGTVEVSAFLNRAADALVEGGQTGVFTPMYYFRGTK